METEALLEAGGHPAGGSEEEEDLQMALEDEEGEAASEVEEGSPFLTALESLKRKRSK